MAAKSDEDYLIERFKPDRSQYGELSKLIAASYIKNSQEEGGTIAFDEEAFNILFGAPTMPEDHFIRAIFKPTGQVVGFTSAFPRDLSYMGKSYKCYIPAWLAVHPDHQGKGIAFNLLTQFYRHLRETYEAAFTLYEPESHGIDVARTVTRKTEIPLKEIFTIDKYIIRILNVKRVQKVVKFKWYEKLVLSLLQGLKQIKNPRIRKYKPEDGEQIFELTRDYTKHNQLALLRHRDELLWYLNQPTVNCVVHEGEDGVVDGFLVAWKFLLAGFGNSIPFGWLDLIHTYRLNLKDATDLFKYLCRTSKDLGWEGLQGPLIPYFNPEPLKKARFVSFSKKLIVGVRNFSSIPLPEKIESFYFDWR